MSHEQMGPRIEAGADGNRTGRQDLRSVKMSTGAELSSFGAIGRAFWDADTDFYPRLGTQKIESVSAETII